MTDRHAGYIVVLDKDVREDDAEGIRNALHHIRGVIDVKPVIGDAGILIATARAETDFKQKLLDAFFVQKRN